AYRLVVQERGLLDNLRLVPMQRRPPGPGEVEIEVCATGLNLRDVLGTLGVYPGDPGPLGGECAGRVSAVGPGVIGLQPGDRVVSTLGPQGSFATHVIAPQGFVVPLGSELSFAQAVTLPVTGITALYGLRHLAGLGRGEKVLIHAATGGVGMMAVQIAQAAGAEIYATAGTGDKRALLRAMGVEHVFDSRSLAFASDIPKGSLHVVLNSLGREFIEPSVQLLAEGGRFVEIGKADIWTAERLQQHYPHLR